MNRRSMSAAISIADPEIKEFLKAGVPAPKTARPKSGDAPPSSEPSDPPLTAEKPKSAAKPVATRAEERPEAAVPVTYRLPERLVKAMIAASAERKIEKNKPWTQQDMAAQAIEEWLRKHNYL